MKTFIATVTHRVKVTMDESKFTNEFNEAFSDMMWDVDGLEDHAEHLAQMKAREMIGFDHFVEGYGDIREMGISLDILSQDTEAEEAKEI